MLTLCLVLKILRENAIKIKNRRKVGKKDIWRKIKNRFKINILFLFITLDSFYLF